MKSSKAKTLKELIELVHRNSADIQETFNRWGEPERAQFCSALSEKLLPCKGLSVSLGGTPIAPDLKPIVEFALKGIPEDHLAAIEENARVQFNIAAIRFPFLDEKELKLMLAVELFCSWAGRGMPPVPFPMVAVAYDQAYKAGVDVYGEEFA